MKHIMFCKRSTIMDTEMKHAISSLQQPEDIMRFFDKFIRYGCVDVDSVEHLDSLGGNDFREKFRTLGLEDALERRIGACIEQANITRYLFNEMGIQSRMFCTRGYNGEHQAPNDLYLIHCYVFGYFGNSVVNIEHSDSEKRGIYVYPSEEMAINETHKMFSDKFMSHGATSTTLDEYTQLIPGGLSFLEVNDYISQFVLVQEERM